MTAHLYPLQVLLVTLAGWVNRHQQHVIEYLVEENRVLKEQVKGRRLRLTDDQRRRLAAKGRRLGRRILRQVATIVTPDTVLRWHRQLIARKWTFTPKRPGRPGIMQEISSLVLCMATENPAWGYSRIQGALKNLGHGVARGTVAEVLKANGIPPAPERPSSWRTFLRAHWGAIAGADFFTSEVWTPRGLITYYTLFVIDLRSRRVHVAGSTPTPDAWFMAQAARRLTDAVDGFLASHQILICDRDSKWTDDFRRIVQGAGVRIVLIPVRAPNANVAVGRCRGRAAAIGGQPIRIRRNSVARSNRSTIRTRSGMSRRLGSTNSSGSTRRTARPRVRRMQPPAATMFFTHWTSAP